jgi:hypothetical protein
VVLCVGLPVVNIDIGQTGNEQLEFLLIENGDELCGDDVVETSEEIVELIVDRTCQAILCDKLDILLLVLLSNRNVASVLDEVDDPSFTEVFRYRLHKVSRWCLSDWNAKPTEKFSVRISVISFSKIQRSDL